MVTVGGRRDSCPVIVKRSSESNHAQSAKRTGGSWDGRDRNAPVFQQALAATAGGRTCFATNGCGRRMGEERASNSPVPQRETVVNAFKFAREDLEHVRPIKLDNSLLLGLRFAPFASPASLPDPRGYEVNASRPPGSDPLSRPDADQDLAFSSIRQLGKLLRNRKISSVELTKLYLQRLRRYDPLLKCVVTYMDDLALKQAERADRELQTKKDRGPLHGIPWGLKDIFAYPGYPTTWGVGQFRDRVIDVKAAVAERLENAGAVLVAKLATNTLAGGSVLWYRGKTRNPWNPRPGCRGLVGIRAGRGRRRWTGWFRSVDPTDATPSGTMRLGSHRLHEDKTRNGASHYSPGRCGL